MKFIKFPIVPILGGFSIGIVIQYYFQIALLSILLGMLFNTLCFLSVYFYVIKKKLNTLFFESVVVLLCLNLGILANYFNTQINYKSHFSNSILERNLIQGLVSEKLKSTTYYDKYILKATHINGQNCM